MSTPKQAPRKPLQIKDSDGRSVPIAISNQVLSPGINFASPQFPTAAVSAPAVAPQPPMATQVPVTTEQNVQPTPPAPDSDVASAQQ